jgi:hypothetical protein
VDSLTGQLVIQEQEFLRLIGQVAAHHGYEAQQGMPGQVRLSKKVTPTVAIVFAILLFPIGLLLLLVKSDLVILVQYNLGVGGNGVGFSLTAPKNVATDFRTMFTPYEHRPATSQALPAQAANTPPMPAPPS